MILRSSFSAALLLLGACEHDASRAFRHDDLPTESDGSSDGQDGTAGEEDGAVGDGAPGDGRPDGTGDGVADGAPGADGEDGEDDSPYVAPAELTVVSADGTPLALRIVDTNAWIVAPIPQVLRYELWARLRNDGDEPISLLGLTAKSGSAARELTGLTQVSAPLCAAAGEEFEPCLLPGDLGVLTVTLSLDQGEDGLDVAQVTATVLGKRLGKGTAHVPMTAALTEAPHAAAGAYYELHGSLRNDTAYALSDVTVDVFPQDEGGKVLARHRVPAFDLAAEGEMTLPASVRPGHAAASFLWFARATRTVRARLTAAGASSGPGPSGSVRSRTPSTPDRARRSRKRWPRSRA